MEDKPKPCRKEIELPQTTIDAFARFLMPEIQKYYAREQGRREFANGRKSKQSNPIMTLSKVKEQSAKD